MKKSIIVLSISLVFLVGCIIFVMLGNVTRKEQIKLNQEYVNTQFELNLYDERIDNVINLYGSAKYIGSDTLEDNISMTMDVACIYTYTDANNEYTDILEDKMTLSEIHSEYTGKLSFELKQENIDGYSCTYTISDVKGSYLK